MMIRLNLQELACILNVWYFQLIEMQHRNILYKISPVHRTSSFLLEIVERVRVKKHEKKSQFLIFSLPEHVQLDVD